MQTRNAFIGLGIAAALAAGGYISTAFAHETGSGRDKRGAYSQYYEPGHGPMHGRDDGHMYGYSRDDRRAQGYGTGHHMHGWGGDYGPGMMHGYGYGPGYGRRMMGR